MLPYTAEAKHRFEACHLAPAQELDAELAACHADACLRAARTLQSLPEDQLAALTTP
jgi:hypothetical protein